MNIIPKPQTEIIKEGNAKISVNSVISGEFLSIKKYFKTIFKGFNDSAVANVEFVKDEKIELEGYSLEVESDKITISASSERGAFYAVQTLVCLTNGSNILSNCSINDKPNYVWRCFMLDSARHFWSVEHIKNTIDMMSLLKLNIFHWHLTDDQGWRIEIKKYPILTEKGAIRKSTQLYPNLPKNDGLEYGKSLFYTQAQITEIVEYAKERYIEIVPEIDMPGHLVAVLSCFPELSCEGKAVDVSNRWGVLDTIGCVGNQKFYDFIKDILDEVCLLFPYKYFHIGGDEVPKTKWKTCAKCQAKMAELNLKTENDLQGYFNNRVKEYIALKGKRLVGWNEILDSTILSNDIVVQWWTPNTGKAKVLKFIENGGKVVLSKHQNFYMDHSFGMRPLRKTYDFNYTDLGIKSDENVLGVTAPQWTEYIKTKEKFDFNTYPRMMALAENAWTASENRNYSDFEIRLENCRGLYEKCGVNMASRFFYNGGSVKGIFKGLTSTLKWTKNPNYEIELKNKINKK